ncbi:MAG: 3-oxoacyl-[acyl-carrier-protein] reductase [Desulfuromusa sp.]|nr:3-oxoacyl-[acyl-carrier-protein] reductase [Desulfuromusa sp.]
MNTDLLAGKVALVTGCGRGIGKAIATTLAQSGADIVVNDIDVDSAEKLAGEIAALGRNAIVCCGSVGDRQAVNAMFTTIVEEFGALDILVNNAGITRDNMMLNMTDEEWNQVIQVNLNGVFYCTQTAVKMINKQTSGRIVNLTSVTGQTGNLGQVNYAAAKAGVIGITKTLARELARYQITVNAVAPGFIDTPMTAAIPDEIKQTVIKDIPLGRAGTPQNIADLVKFLSSDKAAYITGQIISCNGGLYI